MQRFLVRASLMSAVLALGAAPLFADEPSWTTKAPPPATGEQVYRQVCQACHMANGKGGAGAATIPALADNSRLAVAAYPITVVLKGRGAMPWFNDVLTPAQIAAVVGYVRTHFGNAYTGPVTEADVARIAGAKAQP